MANCIYKYKGKEYTEDGIKKLIASKYSITGDMNDKSKDKEIYEEAAKRAIAAIKQGKQVVFDTTNLTKDKRLPFIEAIKKEIPNANIQYKLMELNPELAKQRIKADIAAGKNRANVPDATIDRHAESYKQMLEDIKNEPISNFEITPEQKQQAQQLYSQYLEQNPNDNVEGFKSWVDNNQSNVQYQKQIDLQAEQDDVLEEFANSLSERFNISFDLVSEEEARAMFPKYTNEPAFFDPKTKKAYLVRGKANKTSAVHEIFTHPFLLQIEKTNPTLYKNLLKEAKNNKSVVDYVNNLYGTKQNNDHEYIARAIDLAIQGELNQQKDKTLLGRIQDFFNQLSDYLKQLFNIPKVFSSAISPNITLQQLTQFAMYGKGKMNLNPAQENIEYSLKATNVIVKNLDKIKQWEKNKSISEDVLWNKIQGLGIPKEQIELIKNSEGNTVEEKLLDFTNRMSYTVEINTAKEKPYLTRNDVYYSPNNKGKYEIFEGKNLIKIVETLKQAELEIEELNKKPTQYYSNLTVPGGTNGSYREQNFETPLIKVPKSHAQFNTENTIGFTRGDDRQVYTKNDINSLLEIMQKSGILEVKC